MARDPLAGLRRLPERERRAALDALRLARIPTSVSAAVRWRNPRFRTLPWQRDLAALCDRLRDDSIAGLSPRMTLSAPPRVGKTEHTGRGLPLSAMVASGDDPMPVIYATSAKERAEEVSYAVRTAVERYHRETRDDRFAPGRKWGTLEWETEAGHRWTAFGWTSSTGGVPGRLLIGDDMLGSSEAYRSRSVRMRLRRVWQEDLLSRLESGGGALQMETRRGLEDTTGWLTTEYPDTWEQHVWRMWEPERGYLWPERYGEAWRKANPHLTDSSPVWLALYQQEPVPEGGTLIESEWLTRTYPEDPELAARLADYVVIGVDLAFGGGKRADHCAFVVVAVRGPWRDVLHVTRRQMPWREQVATLRDLMDRWGVQPGNVVVERAANGAAVVDQLAEEVGDLRSEPATRDKAARLTPHLGTVAGALRLPVRAPWRSEYVEELLAFTGVADAHDDQVDATVWALTGAHEPERPDYDDIAAAFAQRGPVW